MAGYVQKGTLMTVDVRVIRGFTGPDGDFGNPLGGGLNRAAVPEARSGRGRCGSGRVSRSGRPAVGRLLGPAPCSAGRSPSPRARVGSCTPVPPNPATSRSAAAWSRTAESRLSHGRVTWPDP